MTKSSRKPYRRLPGSRRDLYGYDHRLWLGDDHLLSVANRRYSEDYKRFYYRDIQAITVGLTTRRARWNTLWGVLLGVTILLGLRTADSTSQIVGASCAAVWLGALFYNSLAGPTCVCCLQTAVQTTPLPSLHRLRLLRKALALLQPFVRQAQANLSLEALPSGGPLSTTQARAARPGLAPPQGIPQRAYRGRWHALLFGCLVGDGLLSGLRLLQVSSVLVWLGWGMALGVLLSTILALANQAKGFPKALRMVTWGALGYAGILYVIRALPGMLLMSQHPALTKDRSQEAVQFLFNAIAAYLRGEGPVAHSIALVSLVCACVLGLVGFGLLIRLWQQSPLPPPMPPVIER